MYGAAAFAAVPIVARAADGKAPVVRFGVITDLHSGHLAPRIGRFYEESPTKLAECASAMNALKPDFLIELGDFKDAGCDAASTLAFLDEIERSFRIFDGPRYHVLGNHDEDTISKDEFLAHVENHGFPKALPHYAFDVKGVRFIVLDGNYNADRTPYCRGNFDWTRAMIPPEEMSWLEGELAATKGRAVVFCHQRMDAKGNPHNLLNADEVRAVLAKSGKVAAVFQGHHHTGDQTVTDGIPFVTFKAAVEGSGLEKNAFALVELFADGSLKVTGYRKEPSRTVGIPS